jgi:hypothetical protein
MLKKRYSSILEKYCTFKHTENKPRPAMKHLCTTVLLLFASHLLHAQFELATPAFYMIADSANNKLVHSESKSVYGKLDTLKFYDVELETETYRNRTTYWVDHKEVDKKTYDFYDYHWKNVDRCTPCFLKTYDSSERLLKEGVQYGDCNIGVWTEYSLTGKIRLKGHFKENDTGDWNEIWKRGLCTVKHGKWIHYDPNGEVLYVLYYENGLEVEEPIADK